MNEMDPNDNVVIYFGIHDYKKRFDRIVRGAYKEADEWGQFCSVELMVYGDQDLLILAKPLLSPNFKSRILLLPE